MENKFSDALFWFEKASAVEPENPIFKGFLGTMLIQSLQADGNGFTVLLYGQISEEQKDVLNRAIDIFSDALEKVEATDLRKSNLTWLLNRGIAKKFLGNIDAALEDIKEAYDTDPENPQFIKHLALILLKTERHLEAGDLLEKIKANPDVPEASVFLADFYGYNDKPGKTIEIVEEFLEWNTDPKLQYIARRILIDAKLQLEQYDEAQSAAEKLIEDHLSKPSAFLEAAKVSNRRKAESNAIEYLKAAKDLITEQTSVANISEIGDAFFSLKMYQEAVECYEKIADPEQDSVFTYKLVSACYEAGILSRALSICRHIREKYGILPHYCEIEIWALEETNDLPQLAELARKYLEENPSDLRVKTKLAQISFLLEDFAATDEIINEDFDVNNLPLDVGITISNLLAIRNDSRKSFNLMYELRRKYFDRAEVHSFYQSRFFLRTDKKSDWLHSESVSLDTAVCVEGADGRQKWFVIEERKNGDLARNEYHIDHPLIKEMLGKHVGDEVPLKPAEQNTEIGVIVEIKSKYVYASHETAEIYESAFPERKDFRSIHVGEPEPSEKPGVHPKIREMIADNSSHSREGLSLYTEQPFTIGMIGKFLGLEGLEIWNRLLSQTDVSVFTSSGDLNVLNETTSLLTENSPPRLVADITSLQLMYQLNVGDEIISCFGKIIVAPTTMISLSNIIQEKERNLDTGYFSIIEVDGQLYKNEVTPEQIKHIVEYFTGFRSWLKLNTEESPYMSGFDVSREEKKDFREIFLPEFYDSIMTVKTDEYLFFTEDERLRQFAQVQFGVRGIWMQPMLAALKKKNAIAHEKYYDALVKLITSSLHFINLDGRSLLEVARTLDWTVNEHFKRATDRLGGPTAEVASSLAVAVNFLLFLAKENKGPRTEEALIICLLESITESGNLTLTLALLRRIIDKRFVLLPYGKMRMLRIIKTWEKAQILKSRGLILPIGYYN